MEWVLNFAFYWWLAVAAFIVTVIVRNSHKKPEVRPVAVKSSSQYGRLMTKKF